MLRRVQLEFLSSSQPVTQYQPVVGAISFFARRLNALQFLTIRQYLSVVFAALVTLLLVLASWP